VSQYRFPAGVQLLTTDQVARRLSYTTQTVRALIKRGRLRAWRLCGPTSNWRIDAASVDELLGVTVQTPPREQRLPDEVRNRLARKAAARSMAEQDGSEQAAAVMRKLDADWERRKAAVLRSLTESPLDRWLRRRR